MLYNFLSESSVLDITLLALGSGIIVLSILGLLHLVKRRGRNKTGHFSEHPGDCEMPAVQTENSDGWPSMEQSQTTEPISVLRQWEEFVIPDFKQTFMHEVDIRGRSALYVSQETKCKIQEVVRKIGGEHMTLTSYVENILRQHFELYKDEINRLHQEQNFHDIL